MSQTPPTKNVNWRQNLLRKFDPEAHDRDQLLERYRVVWLRVVPFALVHLACLGIIWGPHPVPAHVNARAEENRS